MNEREYIIELFEIYKELFTEKQINYFKDYYFEDLSLSEIAENNGVSKSIISKTIIQIENKLKEYEKLLKIKHMKDELTTLSNTIKDNEIKKEIEKIIN